MFTIYEHDKNMNEGRNIREKHDRILHEALTQLEMQIGKKVTLRPNEKGFGDDQVIIYTVAPNGQQEAYRADPILQKQFREEHIARNLHLIKNQKVIVVAEYIAPKTKKLLKEQGLDYVDIHGNCYIHEEAKGEILFIHIEGLKNEEYRKEKYNRAFAKAGLKVIYAFLQDPNLLNKPYRTIAETAGVALGNINYIMNGLMEEGFIQKKNKHEITFAQAEDLLDKWAKAYGEKLKPALLAGTYRFINPNDFDRWQLLNINTQKTCWGGEAAANLWTNYLKPEVLTLYTTETKPELMKNYRLVPDPNGNVYIYRKFWKDEGENWMQNKTHPILTYADLLLTHNMRCLETATMIYEKYIEKTLQGAK